MQINLKLSEIKRIIGADSALDDSFFINKISSLENAQENDLVVVLDKGELDVFGAVSAEKINASKAGIFLTKEEIVPGKKYLLVSDPLKAFQKLVEFVEQKETSKTQNHSSSFISDKAILKENIQVEPFAIIEGGAQIGENSFIGAGVFIGKFVKIGSNVKIHPGVKILDRCQIGDNSIIHSGVIIGSDGFGYKATRQGLQKIPQIGIVKIGSNVEIGANSCIDRAAFDETVIGNGVKIDNLVHIAHNVKIGDHTVILALTGIAGSAQIGAGCMIGGHVGIRDHIKIGNGVKVVSKSAVMNDIKDGETVAGSPAVNFGQWKRISVATLKLPEVFKEFLKFKSLLESNKKTSFWKKIFRLK
jgi:UDP-3-O-[3-hydroxymyristoyl] glucosamine N-acyltransferase